MKQKQRPGRETRQKMAFSAILGAALLFLCLWTERLLSIRFSHVFMETAAPCAGKTARLQRTAAAR